MNKTNEKGFNMVGRPKVDYEVYRPHVPVDLKPKLKEMIEQWKLERKKDESK